MLSYLQISQLTFTELQGFLALQCVFDGALGAPALRAVDAHRAFGSSLGLLCHRSLPTRYWRLDGMDQTVLGLRNRAELRLRKLPKQTV